jgi:hypothetical protein
MLRGKAKTLPYARPLAALARKSPMIRFRSRDRIQVGYD